jgi:hypothetical protein
VNAALTDFVPWAAAQAPMQTAQGNSLQIEQISVFLHRETATIRIAPGSGAGRRRQFVADVTLAAAENSLWVTLNLHGTDVREVAVMLRRV